MLITVLAALIVTLSISQPEIAAHFAAPSLLTPVLCAVYIAVGVVLTVASTQGVTRRLQQGQTPPQSAFRRHRILETAYRFWLVAGQGALIACGYARWVHNALGGCRIPLLEKFVLLSPPLAMIVIGWVLDYPFHRAMRIARGAGSGAEPAYWSRRRHVLHHIRHTLLFVLVPISLILLVTDLLEMHLPALAPAEMREPIYLIGSTAAAFTVFLFAPLILTRIWRTKSLAPGELRSDLEDLCVRLKIRYRDILVWKSDGVIANAAVMGLIAPVRYIIVSDGILNTMDRRHIRAVFAHEGGHVTARHLPYLMILAIVVLVFCEFAAAFIAARTGMSVLPAALLTLGLIFVVGWLIFGAVSRKFERHSDVIGAWASGLDATDSPRITHEGAAIFAGALQEIARLNGMEQSKRNWRHGSIASRVQHILMLGSTAGERTQIDGAVRRIKLAIIFDAIAAAVIVLIRSGVVS